MENTENLSATPLRAPGRGGRSVTILVVADVLNNEKEDMELARIIVNDFVARDLYGFEKYGQNLETNDGRPTVWDIYQELLDACQYSKKLIEEGDLLYGMENVYPTLMALTRITRKAILKSEEAINWSKPNDSDKKGNVRLVSEERQIDPGGNS